MCRVLQILGRTYISNQSKDSAIALNAGNQGIIQAKSKYLWYLKIKGKLVKRNLLLSVGVSDES